MNLYDFSFLAPCPASGLVISGTADQVVPNEEIERTVSKIRTQKNIVIEHQKIAGANHFYTEHLEELTTRCAAYLDKRLAALRKELEE